MSCNCAALPNSFEVYREVQHIDFEFRIDGNHRAVSVAMFAKERRSGRETQLRRDQLLTLKCAPFDVGPGALMVSYSIVAELSCFKALDWPMPRNALCTYFLASAQVNGLDIDGLRSKRPSLLESCSLFGVPHATDAEHKERMRRLILENETYTEEQWLEIEEYNREDVLLDIQLLSALAPAIDLPHAVFWARYGVPVVEMEARGLPVDVARLNDLRDNWQAIRLHYIRRDDVFGLYDGDGSMCEDRLAALINERGWIWPGTAKSGKPELKAYTLAKQCERYPELKPLQRLRDQIAELRLGAFVDTVGADGASRCPIMPFWTKTGRNQPQGKGKVFLPSLPAWVHGLIKPPEGWGVACLDWSAQEIGILAGLSEDPAMIADYASGDFHLRFAIRGGLAPEDATKATHGTLRDTIKPISLGVGYGRQAKSIARGAGKSVFWAEEMLARHRHAYGRFYAWRENVIASAQFAERIESPFGWPMAVIASFDRENPGTKRTTLMNYLAQSGGADMMRIAAIAAAEAGISVCAPVHDSFWIAAPLAELDDAIAEMSAITARAGEVVAGIPIPVEKSAEVRWPQCLGEVRKAEAKGAAMWAEVMGLVYGDLRKAGG